MRDDHAGRLQFFEALAHHRLRAVVERARRLVEKEDARPVDDRARNHQSLPLSARQGPAALADDGVHSHRHRLDVVREAGHARCLPRLVERGGAGADDVGEDVSGHQPSVLQHDADLPPQGSDIETANLLAVVINRSGFDPLEPEQEPQQRGLARTGRPDEGRELARADVEGDIAQHRRAISVVAEFRMVQLDVAREHARIALRRVDLRPRFQNGLRLLVERDDRERTEHGGRRSEHCAEARGKGREEPEEITSADRSLRAEHRRRRPEDDQMRSYRERAVEGSDDVADRSTFVLQAALTAEPFRPQRERRHLGAAHAQAGNPREELQYQARGPRLQRRHRSLSRQLQCARDDGDGD